MKYADGTEKITPELPTRTVNCSLKYASIICGMKINEETAR